MLAIIPILVYVGWTIKKLMNEIISNRKGGEYK